LCHAAIQLQFPRNNGFREVAFADEVWHHVDVANLRFIEEEKCVPQTCFLFPKAARDLAKNAFVGNRPCLSKAGPARIGVHRRSVPDNQESGISAGRTHRQSVKHALPIGKRSSVCQRGLTATARQLETTRKSWRISPTSLRQSHLF